MYKKKNIILIIIVFLLIALIYTKNSCKDDNVPLCVTVSFEDDYQTVENDNGTPGVYNSDTDVAIKKTDLDKLLKQKCEIGCIKLLKYEKDSTNCDKSNISFQTKNKTITNGFITNDKNNTLTIPDGKNNEDVIDELSSYNDDSNCSYKVSVINEANDGAQIEQLLLESCDDTDPASQNLLGKGPRDQWVACLEDTGDTDENVNPIYKLYWFKIDGRPINVKNTWKEMGEITSTNFGKTDNFIGFIPSPRNNS